MQIVSSHNENNCTHLCFVRKRSPRDFFSILLEAIFSNPDPFYLNLHTSVNPGGALRDQLQRTDTVVRRADMWPANEVPPVTDLVASAAAKVTLHVTRDDAGEITSGTVVFDVSFQFPAESEFTGLHIHKGTANVSGGVTISSGLTSFVSEEGSGNILRSVNMPGTDTTGLDTLQDLPANPDGYYVNLHTTAHPPGAVRGQTIPPGPPSLPANSVVNGASFRLATDPNGAIAPGAIVTIFGTDLAGGTQQASDVPLPTTLGDTSVTFNDIAAPAGDQCAGPV